MKKKQVEKVLHIAGFIVIFYLLLIIFAWGHGAKQPLVSICCLMVTTLSLCLSKCLSLVGFDDMLSRCIKGVLK